MFLEETTIKTQLLNLALEKMIALIIYSYGLFKFGISPQGNHPTAQIKQRLIKINLLNQEDLEQELNETYQQIKTELAPLKSESKLRNNQ